MSNENKKKKDSGKDRSKDKKSESNKFCWGKGDLVVIPPDKSKDKKK